MNKREHAQQIKQHNTEWFRHGENTLRGIAKASVPYGNVSHPPLFLFRYLRKIVIDTVYGGQLDHDFSTRPLIPIIYCHGLSSNRTMHSGTARDFASHGYLVFLMDHKDESSSYYETSDGKGYYYNNKLVAHDMEHRNAQLKIRQEELTALLDEICQADFPQKKLGFDAKIDTHAIVIGGHSFGAMTAVHVAQNDKRIKACITMDPWLFV